VRRTSETASENELAGARDMACEGNEQWRDVVVNISYEYVVKSPAKPKTKRYNFYLCYHVGRN
jgi:hypothetical protein